jgi:CRP/FNR family transcriptional regulator, cyclic AMP receptor protein
VCAVAPDEFHPRSFLARLDPAAREHLAELGTLITYRARSTLFHQGEPTRHVLLLLAGWVTVASTSRAGEEALLAIRGPGDILGELSALDGQPRSATLSAITPVRATVVDGDRFRTALLHRPDLALALLQHIAENLRESDRKRLEFVSTNSSGRVATLILRLATDHGLPSDDGVVIPLPLTQRELATAAATSREVVARALRALRERDIVRTQRQRIVVVRPDVLRSLCQNMSGDT